MSQGEETRPTGPEAAGDENQDATLITVNASFPSARTRVADVSNARARRAGGSFGHPLTMPAPTVAPVASSTRMNDPVARFSA